MTAIFEEIFGDSEEDLEREMQFCLDFNEWLIKREEEIKTKEENGFLIRMPGKYKIGETGQNLLDSNTHIEEWPRNIHIKGISSDAFDEVCENPDILIIKED